MLLMYSLQRSYNYCEIGEKMKRIGSIALASIAIIIMAAMAVSVSSKQEESDMVSLPQPRTDGGISVEKALFERRSIRSFKNESLTLDEVSQLLWAAQGVTDDKGHRTSPSAMASYPLEVYLLAGNVTGLSAGVYHYSPHGHNLTVISLGNKIDELFSSSLRGKKDWRALSPAVIIITGVFERINKVPGQDLSRFVYVETGTAAENLLLEVVSLGLGATYTAGFDENRTRECLGLARGEDPIAVLPVGRKA
ncbi:Nitroreductase family protein [uncultured archaeon]|nr:Nitroreductase family protein [uncultured archaeon]